MRLSSDRVHASRPRCRNGQDTRGVWFIFCPSSLGLGGPSGASCGTTTPLPLSGGAALLAAAILATSSLALCNAAACAAAFSCARLSAPTAAAASASAEAAARSTALASAFA